MELSKVAKPGVCGIKVVSSQINETAVSVDLQILGETSVVSPEMASRLLQQYPNLAEHACKSGRTSKFDATDATNKTSTTGTTAQTSKIDATGKASKIDATSKTGTTDAINTTGKTNTTGKFAQSITGALLPHLVEHLAIELLVQADASSNTGARPYAGNTTWLSHSSQTMRVRVSHYNAASTQAAIYAAIEQVNRLL